MNKMYLVLGDWSDDGHGKSDKILFECNKSVLEIQEAYKASCKLTGMSFNDDDSEYTGIERTWRDSNDHRIATDYVEGSPILTSQCIEILEKFSYPELDKLTDNRYVLTKTRYIKLWWWFVSLSLPDIEWHNPRPDDIPVINGYWDSNLNTQFGYGLYE